MLDILLTLWYHTIRERERRVSVEAKATEEPMSAPSKRERKRDKIMYERYVKIRPEHKFSVPLGNHERFGYKTFDTIGEAVFFAERLLGKYVIQHIYEVKL